MKKVLIITYYWPPAGGPGVQRILKFVKYLPQFGWQPIILTVRNGEFQAIDKSLEDEIPDSCVIKKTFSLEPNNLYKKFLSIPKEKSIPNAVLTEKNTSLKKKFANWIRVNFFIPDAKIGWIPFAIKSGKKLIKRYKPDLILSSSPPPTVNLIAKKLSKWSKIPWIADFRDPWTDIYHYDSINKNFFVKWFENRLEKKVFNSADHITTVSSDLRRIFYDKIYKDTDVSIIANGYDKTDFSDINDFKEEKFRINYAGKMNKQQNPKILWEILEEMINDKNFASDLEIYYMGNIPSDILSKIKKGNLSRNFNFLGYLPHKKVIKLLAKSSMQLLFIPDTKKNKGILTGKLFEYLALQKFILGFGPVDGDASKILEQTKAGKLISFQAKKELENILKERYKFWKENKDSKIDKKSLEKYSREELTKKLVNIMNKI